MNLRQFFSRSLIASAMFVASAASQAYVVTINPAGTPLGCIGSAFCNSFQADSVAGSLGSSLKITNFEDPNLAGPFGASYVESGQIAINTFKNGASDTSVAGPLLPYQIWATFTLQGNGIWSKNLLGETIFTATTATLSNSQLFGSTGGNPAVLLANLSLLPGNLSAVANATAKSTVLSALFGITPVAGSTGLGGFFELPTVWDVDLFANTVGFGPGTGTVSPDPLVDGQPAVFETTNFATTPVNQGGSGSFNGAFQRVPEPGTLALLAVALIGLGYATKRREVS